jgi:DNA primase
VGNQLTFARLASLGTTSGSALACRELRAQRRADAQAKNTAVPPSPPSRAVDFAAIRTHLQIKDVLELLGFQARTARGTQLRGACPLHGSTRGTARCFSVNTDKQVFHCFKCGSHGNALDLWAQARRLSPFDAALDLCQRLHLPGTLNAPTGNREEEPVINSLAPCPTQDTIHVAGAFQNQLLTFAQPMSQGDQREPGFRPWWLE